MENSASYQKMTCIDLILSRRFYSTAALVVLLWPGQRVVADEVHTRSKVYSDATVRHFDGEFVIFFNSSGDVVARRLDEVEAIFVDSVEQLEDFNRAERSFQNHQYAEAARRYKSALGRARDFWKDLIAIRYLRACDAGGDFEQAVRAYITVARTMGEKADVHMPSNLAGATPESIRAALALLDKTLPNTADQSTYWQLEALRLTILEQVQSDRAGDVAEQIIAQLQQQSGSQARFRLQIIAIRIAVKHAQFSSGLGHINAALKNADDEFLPELLFLKGKCLFGLAESRDDYIRAGLSFMRVVIHFSDSRLCARSMYMAGLVHEKINRVQKAVELFENCKELPGADGDVIRLAETAARKWDKQE